MKVNPFFHLPLLVALALLAASPTVSTVHAQAPDATKTKTPEDAAFEERMKKVKEALDPKRAEGEKAFFAELEKQARELQKEFPNNPVWYQMLFGVAQSSDTEKARAL